MSSEITLPLAGTFVGLLGALAFSLLKDAKEKRVAQRKNVLSECAERNITKIRLGTAGGNVVHRPDREPTGKNIKITDDLIEQVEEGIVSRISSKRSLSAGDIQGEVDTAVAEVKERLEQIESWFPDDSSIDKISSINDALFAERIEQLASRLTYLENNQLTKWDVALVVSLVLAGLFAVVAATYGTLDALGILAN